MRSDQASWGTAAARPAALPAPPPALSALFATADVQFNGHRPWDIQVRHPRLYQRLLTQWSLGAGESYVDGDWDCEALDELAARLMRADLDKQPLGWGRLALALEALRHSLFNLQSERRAFDVGERHYDAGNDLFEAMLDSRMVYSCGYWATATTLEEAQFAKLDMVCRKLQLQPGERLLDIGCGWGGLARHAAEHYGVQVTGVTVSREQWLLARERCAGLPIDLRLMDYRQLEGRFDKVASIGMFEHVGPKNYATYFDTARRLLAPGDLFLLHTIGSDTATGATDPWIDRYVFPNGKLPAARELAEALEGRLLIEDWHNFGADYDLTLMRWWQRLDAARPRLPARYDERFYRHWRYYLLCCAGFFRSRQGQLWQLVLTHRERAGVYRSVRP